MKKIKKILAVLSSAVMALSACIMQVSAGFESKIYDTIYTSPNGNISPMRVREYVCYSGIVVTMPDGAEPTAEEIGIDCPISEYSAVNCGKISDFAGKGTGWTYEETVEPEENQYKLCVESIMSEDEAIDFAKKLVIRGIVEKAEVLYDHYINNGQIGRDAIHRNWVFISFADEEAAADFSFDKYPEIKETLRYTEYDSYIGDSNTITVYGLIDTSVYYTENLSTMEIYNDVKALNDILTEKYDEIEKVDISFMYLCSEDSTPAVYPVEPKWGDATNDDKIDLYDAIETAKYILGTSNMSEDSVLLADINRDGVTDLLDVIDIAELINS